jgi:hypothetical protein
MTTTGGGAAIVTGGGPGILIPTWISTSEAEPFGNANPIRSMTGVNNVMIVSFFMRKPP